VVVSSKPRVLLVSANRERAPQPVVPNGVACVASALRQAGYDVSVLDLCFVRDAERTAREAARRCAPDVIGLSVRNIDNSDLIALRHYTPEAAAVTRALRDAAPQASIIAGGAAFGVAPGSLTDALGVDWAVAGDGERATVALLEALAAGRDPGEIPGLVRRDASGTRLIPLRGDAGLDALPAMRVQDWIDIRAYQRHGATVPIQTKRGCVFRCVYCTYLNVEGWGYRLREPESVVDEIASLVRECGVRRFEFVDSTFNSPPRHAIAVCEAIIRRRLGVHLDTTNFTPASATPELLDAMRPAGFRWLGITAESASDEVLARLEKGFDAARVHDVAARVERAGMRVLWIFLVGGPGETPATLEETLRFADWRLSRGDAVYLTVGLRIYPGTTLQRIAVDEGVLDSNDALLRPTFYFSPALDREFAVARLRDFARRHPRFMFSADSRSSLLPYLTRLASALRLPGPHWRYMGVFRRVSNFKNVILRERSDRRIYSRTVDPSLRSG
jgi:anaerobic magnesium-protoporphyrin IX monomethyl ester cyclase